MTEIYFEYYFNEKPKQFNPNLPSFAKLRKEVIKTKKYYLEFYDYLWGNNISVSKYITQILDGVIIPKESEKHPEKYKNITYGIFNAIQITKGSIKIVNDLFGAIPSFYYHDKDIFIYSTKIKPIISRLKNLNKSVSENKDAINFIKEVGFLISDYTYVFEIKRMLSATEIIIKNNKVTQIQYHRPNATKRNSSEKKLFQILNRTFSMIFSEINKGVGLTLSGGLDSRVIAGQILKNNIKATAITYGFNNSSEIKIAKKVAKITKLKLIRKSFNIKDILASIDEDNVLKEGFVDNLNSYLPLIKDTLINNHIHYLFNGFLGDAVLGGSYITRKTNSVKELIKELMNEINKKTPENKIIQKASDFIVSRTFKFKNKQNYEKNKKIVLTELKRIKRESNVKEYEDLVNLYFIYNSAFRNTMYGVLSSRPYSEIVIPFMGNDFFLELLKMSQYRFKYHRVYKKYMIQEFPMLAKLKSKNWGVNCYKSTLYQRLSEYMDGFIESVIKPKLNSIMNKNIFRKNSYVDYPYWFRESNEFRKFMGTNKFKGFEKKEEELIRNIINE